MKILFLAVATLFVAGCSQEKKEEPVKSAAIKKEVVKKVEPVKQVKEVAPVKTESVPKKVAVVKETGVDGAKIFVKCSSCHGKNAQKKALGKSQVIKGWKESKIVTALHGYKRGTYGGSMKAIMKGQASGLNDAEINAVAKYISNL